MTTRRVRTFFMFIICNWLMLSTTLTQQILGELYTSVSELGKLQATTKFYAHTIAKQIAGTKDTLEKLNKLLTHVTDIDLAFSDKNTKQCHQHSQINNNNNNNGSSCLKEKSIKLQASTPILAHPAQALRLVHSLVKVENEINKLNESLENLTSLSSSEFDCSDCLRVSDEDLIGSAEALIRLQKFYSLKATDLINNNILSKPEQAELGYSVRIMQYDDCFVVANVLFSLEEYESSIEWLQNSLMLASQKDVDVSNDFKAKVLEYLAFSAFKIGRIKYAAQITQNWLILDPNNEKAKKNLKYYIKNLNHSDNVKYKYLKGDSGKQTSYFGSKRLQKQALNNSTSPQNDNNNNLPNLYDDSIKSLCNVNQEKLTSHKLYCFKQPLLEAIDGRMLVRGHNVEVISDSPQILRVYNFVNDHEASHIINSAMPKLHRSTVQTNSGEQTPTDYRIAKTAWLSGHRDGYVSVIEGRIRDLLDLDDNSSEDMQVVNYGLGGFYGPHVDATRAAGGKTSSALFANDRLVTVLMYLTSVEVGGSTVFPNIGVSIEPIKNSAVLWFNLFRNGSGDSRTLHTGCPVFLGSKWIATKWIRERSNIFRRACGLDKTK